MPDQRAYRPVPGTEEAWEVAEDLQPFRHRYTFRATHGDESDQFTLELSHFTRSGRQPTARLTVELDEGVTGMPPITQHSVNIGDLKGHSHLSDAVFGVVPDSIFSVVLKGDEQDINGMKRLASWLVLQATQRSLKELTRLGDPQSATDDLDAEPEEEWLLKGIVTNDKTTLFGQGEVGKTSLAYRIGVTVNTGIPFLGEEPLATGSVIAFVWEEGSQTHAKRRTQRQVRRVVEGLRGHEGFDPDEVDIDVRAFSGPLHEHITEVLDILSRRIYALVIIDPFRMAAGGHMGYSELSDFETAVQLIEVPTLIIDHEGSTPGKTAGREVKEHAGRHMILVKRRDSNGVMSLWVTKSNYVTKTVGQDQLIGELDTTVTTGDHPTDIQAISYTDKSTIQEAFKPRKHRGRGTDWTNSDMVLAVALWQEKCETPGHDHPTHSGSLVDAIEKVFDREISPRVVNNVLGELRDEKKLIKHKKVNRSVVKDGRFEVHVLTDDGEAAAAKLPVSDLGETFRKTYECDEGAE